MNIKMPKQKIQAMTFFEVLVVVSIIVLLVALYLASLPDRNRKVLKINCINNLKQIGLTYRIWEGDHNDKFPSFVSVTNGGIMEWTNCGAQIIISNYLVMSNEVSNPKILACPQDTKVVAVGDFGRLTISNISYFVNLDASDALPQMILSGDDNLLVNGSPVPSGNLVLPTNAVVTWSKYRHNGAGNLGLVDGSALEVPGAGLTVEFSSSGAPTNRIVIP